MHLQLALEGSLEGFAQAVHLRHARGARNAAEIMAVRAKMRLRADTLAGGLRQRTANAWRADIYPRSAGIRTHEPAVLIYSKAAKIMQAFAEATTIVSKSGVWLAIPTDNVPRRGGKRMTPVDIEAQFNQDLIFRAGRGQQMLAFVDAIKAKSGRGYRRATKRRTKDGRENELVLMFVMVRQVHLKKRLSWPAIYDAFGREWTDLYATEVAKQLAPGSN